MTGKPHRATILDAVPVFRAASVARSARWYADALGFSVDAVGPPDDPVFAILRRDGVELMLQKVIPGVGEPRSATRAGGGWDAYIRVNDAEAARQAVVSRIPEVDPIETQVYGCREFVVIDPDGHVIVFGECG
jgi:catechol 2,3-dioxygenase-like lactoylglutathione lyase family enzyme